MSTTPTADLMTLAETAAYLNMSEKSLRWMRHTGNAPRAGKIGARVVFRRSDVDAWIEKAFEETA